MCSPNMYKELSLWDILKLKISKLQGDEQGKVMETIMTSEEIRFELNISRDNVKFKKKQWLSKDDMIKLIDDLKDEIDKLECWCFDCINKKIEELKSKIK